MDFGVSDMPLERPYMPLEAILGVRTCILPLIWVKMAYFGEFGPCRGMLELNFIVERRE